jgi:hypothetical protein
MRSLKMVGLLLLVISAIAIASENKLGIQDVRRITFSETIRIGSNVVPAGQYVVRHTMDGQDHLMAFERVNGKDIFKVKCTLVPLPHKADVDQSIYETSSAKEKVLLELVFRGDTAKHVF